MSQRRFPGGVNRTRRGDGGGDRPSFKYTDRSEFEAGSVAEKRLGGGTEVGERSEEGRGAGQGNRGQNVVLVDKVDDGGQRRKSGKGAAGYDRCYEQRVPVGWRNSCRRFLRVRGTRGRRPMVNF